MARTKRKPSAKKRRYRVYERSLSYRFLDVYARNGTEAREIMDGTDESLYHYIDDDWESEYVRIVESDESFFPVNDPVA